MDFNIWLLYLPILAPIIGSFLYEPLYHKLYQWPIAGFSAMILFQPWRGQSYTLMQIAIYLAVPAIVMFIYYDDLNENA